MFAPLFVGWLLPAILEPDCRGTAPRLLFLAVEGPLITVALSVLHDRHSDRQRTAGRALPMSIALAAIVGAAVAVGASALTSKLGIPFVEKLDAQSAPRVVGFGVVVGVIQFVIWALSFVYPFAIEDARLRALEAEKHKLEAERLRLESSELRTSAELASLRSRLEPHFLLNTLNAIAGLVTQRPKEARRLLGCVGDLLRDSLRDPEEMQLLDQELTWLRRYAEIIEARHSGALVFRWEIDDEARTCVVPRLLLQPLVENAVNHGALERSSGGEVSIRVRIEEIATAGAELVCEIEDNGPGMPEKEPRSGAFGVESVRRRLALRYEGASLRFESSNSGTRAIVRLPRIASETRPLEARAQ